MTLLVTCVTEVLPNVMFMVKMVGRDDPAVATMDIALVTYLRLPRLGYDEDGNVIEAGTDEIVIKREDRVTLKK